MINYFVSSTFRDMQAERDALQNVILPEIRKTANLIGQDVFLTDLRWGIDTSNTDVHKSMNKIMSICMSEIDNCHPHMIILLGDRYGSLPDNVTFESFLKSSHGQFFSARDKGKSITEMEIIHGLFHCENDDFTICIREPLKKEEIGDEMIPVFYEAETPFIEKLAHLKKELIERFPQNVLSYSVKWDKKTDRITGLDEFISKLTLRLCSQIKENGSVPSTPERAQQNADELFVATQSKSFVGRETYLQEIHENMESSNYSQILITGVSGVGKSCLMAKIAEIYGRKGKTVSIFCGNSPYIHDDMDLMHNLVYRLCCILDMDYSVYTDVYSISTLKETAEMLIQQIEDKVFIIIDSLDSIVSESDIHFLPDIGASDKCKIIVSTRADVKELHFSNNRWTIRLDVMDENELSEMIDLRLLNLRKELPLSSRDILLRKVAYHTPLYSSMAFQRVSSLNQFDFKKISSSTEQSGDAAKALYRYIEDAVNNLPEREDELCIYLAEFCQYSFQFPFRSTVLQILCLFPKGIRHEDIIGIAQKMGQQVSVLDLRTYLNSLSSMVYITQNNRVQFLHKTIYDALKNRFSENTDSIYHATLLYFKELVNDDSMKLSDYIRIAYRCEDYRAIAEYLASLYLAEENYHLIDEEKINLINTAMTSLRLVFNEIQDEKLAFDFVKAVINSISEENVEKIYGLCCAFLFSYDSFFANLSMLGKADCIMEIIKDKCIRILYPHRKEHPLYLRAVYVSCEQYGIRTTDYETRFNAYSLFNHYCLEMFEMTQDQSRFRIDIINDLSLSYSKLGDLWRVRDWRRATAYYEKAIETASIFCDNDRRSSVLRYRMYSAYCEKASCIIQKAIRNNMIGWSMDDEMSKALNKAKDMLIVAIDHYKSDNREEYVSQNADLAYCYMYLADWARATANTELELHYTKTMVECAELAYRKKHSILMYDLIRNGEFRLGYQLKLGTAEEHLQKAFSMASEIKHEMDTSTTHKILYYAGGQLLLNYAEKIKNQSSNNTDAASEMCIEALGKFIPIMDLLFTEDDGEKHYQAIIDILQNTIHNFNAQRELAIQALNRHDYSFAYKKAKYSFGLLLAIEWQYDRKKWLIQMLDTSHLLSVCSHNARTEGYKHLNADINNDEYLNTEISSIGKTYYSILCYDMLYGQDNLLKKYKSIFSNSLGNYICSLYGWLEFAAKNINDLSREDLFWEYLDRQNYCIPNSRTVYFDLLRNTETKKLLEEYIQIIGKYLYEHFQDVRVQKLLYFSLLFEDITLEYTYQVLDYETVIEIIENGYDRYLELSTLYIIRKHDRKEFYKRAKELKFICVKNHRKLIRQEKLLYAVTGSLFLSEADNLFKSILDSIETFASDDPRMHSERSIYKFRR